MTAPPPMTPARWRAVDAVLQRALACEPAEREACVAEACGDDAALRREVSSLLAAHDAAGADFLERPAGHSFAAFAERPETPSGPPPVEALGTPLGTPPSAPLGTPAGGRMVPARTVFAALVGAFIVGSAAGALVTRTAFRGAALLERVASQVPTVSTAPATGNVVDGAAGDAQPLVVVDRNGGVVRGLVAERPWTPRFSPDGRRVAFGAFGAGRRTSDLWVTDLTLGATRRLTDDGDDANDPQWSADGATLVYSVSAPGGKDLVAQRLDGGTRRALASRGGVQFASDWSRDGGALLVTEDAGERRRDILVQPADGSPARPYLATRADETAARFSPDGRWVAYTSDASGRAEVYIAAYLRAGAPVRLSRGGGIHPVWRGDGRELYYWRDGALVAVTLGAPRGAAPPAAEGERVLFRANYPGGFNTMYDVSPDGTQFVIVRNR